MYLSLTFALFLLLGLHTFTAMVSLISHIWISCKNLNKIDNHISLLIWECFMIKQRYLCTYNCFVLKLKLWKCGSSILGQHCTCFPSDLSGFWGQMWTWHRLQSFWKYILEWVLLCGEMEGEIWYRTHTISIVISCSFSFIIYSTLTLTSWLFLII